MSAVEYKIGDIVSITGIVYQISRDGHPTIRTDYSGRTTVKVGEVKIGDYIKHEDRFAVVCNTHFELGGFDGWITATKEEYERHIKSKEQAAVKDISTETLMEEIVRRHREKGNHKIINYEH